MTSLRSALTINTSEQPSFHHQQQLTLIKLCMTASPKITAYLITAAANGRQRHLRPPRGLKWSGTAIKQATRRCGICRLVAKGGFLRKLLWRQNVSKAVSFSSAVWSLLSTFHRFNSICAGGSWNNHYWSFGICVSLETINSPNFLPSRIFKRIQNVDWGLCAES